MRQTSRFHVVKLRSIYALSPSRLPLAAAVNGLPPKTLFWQILGFLGL